METAKTHTGAARAQRGGKQIVAGAAPAKAADVRQIEIDLIDPSKTNPRKDFGDLTGLAASIETQGIIEPLIVRPKGHRFEIVAGERRFRAAKLANLEKLLSIVRELSDADAIEIQGIENIQRQNLKPLEEAAQYRLLINTKPDKFSAEAIGKRQGKSAQWVWDLMKLLDLTAEAKKLLDEGRISVNHAIPIARLTPEQQMKVIESPGALFQSEGHTLFDDDEEDRKPEKYAGMKPRSVKELQTYIAEHIRFDPHKAAAAAPMLFEDAAKQVDEAVKRPGRGKKVIAITHNSYVQPDAKDPNERTFSSTTWRRADGKFDSKTCDSSALGVVVTGRGYGDTFEVCVARDKCKVHFPEAVRAKEKREKEKAKESTSASAVKSTKRSDADIAKDKAAAAQAELENQIDSLGDKMVDEAVKEKLASLPPKLSKAVLALTIKFLDDQIYGIDFKNATQDNLAHIIAVGAAKLDIEDGYDADKWLKALGVDEEKLRAKARAQLQTSGDPKPKVKIVKKK